MKPILQTRRIRESGLTLVEILVASALLLFITLGLTMMFNQTQKAFRGGMRQTDVVEAGRAALDLISRDFEQMVDAGSPNVTNFFSLYVTNVVQEEAGQPFRTNEVFDVFAMTQSDAQWMAVGYAVTNKISGGSTFSGLGSLHRFSMTNTSEVLTNSDMFFEFGNQIDGGNFKYFNRVIDGVIHFKVHPIDTNGVILTNSRISFPTTTAKLPNAVEIELGILEPQIVEQARGMPSTAQVEFLRKQAGKVHLFRQQVPVRTARK